MRKESAYGALLASFEHITTEAPTLDTLNLAARTIDDTYDHMLRLQADLAISLERPALATEAWESAASVLDAGCGNAYYVSQLAIEYPEKSFVGIDSNPALLRRYRPASQLSNLTLKHTDITTISDEPQYDIALARFIFMHVPNRNILARCLHAAIAHRGQLIVVEADDEPFLITPPLPRYLETLGALRSRTVAKGGNRTLLPILERELAEIGFAHRLTRRVIVHSDLPNAKERMMLYMLLTAELAQQGPLPLEVHEELLAWYTSPHSYVQYGEFVSIYDRLG